MLNRSGSRMKDYNRMGTVRSDSSRGSKRFKFRPKVGKNNAITQTDKKAFEVNFMDIKIK